MSELGGDVKILIEHVTKVLVDAPDQVSVNQVEEDGETVLELTVAESDVGSSAPGIVGPHYLERTPIARALLFDHHDPILRLFARTRAR